LFCEEDVPLECSTLLFNVLGFGRKERKKKRREKKNLLEMELSDRTYPGEVIAILAIIDRQLWAEIPRNKATNTTMV
jgi:hypothetical protein